MLECVSLYLTVWRVHNRLVVPQPNGGLELSVDVSNGNKSVPAYSRTGSSLRFGSRSGPGSGWSGSGAHRQLRDGGVPSNPASEHPVFQSPWGYECECALL